MALLMILLGGQFVAAQWWYGDPVDLGDEWAWCEIPVEEVVEEEWCTDPFFHDMEVKAAEAHKQEMNDIHEPVPAPTYESYPDSGDPEFPMHVIFAQPIDVELPTQEAEVPAQQAKVEEQRIAAPYVAPAEDLPQLKAKEDSWSSQEWQEEEISAREWYSLSPYVRSYRPLVLRFIETWEEVTEHASAASIISTVPQTVSVAYVFEHHLWEIVFIAFLIFMLFSLMFI